MRHQLKYWSKNHRKSMLLFAVVSLNGKWVKSIITSAWVSWVFADWTFHSHHSYFSHLIHFTSLHSTLFEIVGTLQYAIIETICAILILVLTLTNNYVEGQANGRSAYPYMMIITRGSLIYGLYVQIHSYFNFFHRLFLCVCVCSILVLACCVDDFNRSGIAWFGFIFLSRKSCQALMLWASCLW